MNMALFLLKEEYANVKIWYSFLTCQYLLPFAKGLLLTRNDNHFRILKIV
ncbi:hypothetical protein HMPREF0645_0630 [Hallella bergensis DSM 17361]|uniref:Uncharacterized protein n=1 Tax=Hallella bergensis DSM 17361 TaxID=585502 RepID=D1PUJ5_9BACT|nr:hypothetical protein HMPREF0645_0630 [Hallella bergensis DSM 17361]